MNLLTRVRNGEVELLNFSGGTSLTVRTHNLFRPSTRLRYSYCLVLKRLEPNACSVKGMTHLATLTHTQYPWRQLSPIPWIQTKVGDTCLSRWHRLGALTWHGPIQQSGLDSRRVSQKPKRRIQPVQAESIPRALIAQDTANCLR